MEANVFVQGNHLMSGVARAPKQLIAGAALNAHGLPVSTALELPEVGGEEREHGSKGKELQVPQNIASPMEKASEGGLRQSMEGDVSSEPDGEGNEVPKPVAISKKRSRIDEKELKNEVRNTSAGQLVGMELELGLEGRGGTLMERLRRVEEAQEAAADSGSSKSRRITDVSAASISHNFDIKYGFPSSIRQMTGMKV